LPVSPPPTGDYPWVGKAIQQDLVADLTESTVAQVIAPVSAPQVTDPQAALQAGRQAGATFVLFGQAHTSGELMRVTGELLDVSSGRPLAGLKATAPADDLFPLEDSLAAQALQALPPSLARANTGPQGAQPMPAPYAEQAPVPEY